VSAPQTTSADHVDGQAVTDRARYLVRAVDKIDERIAGHAGIAYASPLQTLADALALVRLLLGGPVDAPERRRWTRPIAGGRRMVTLERAAAP
jgi:hypothetical protein